MLAVFFLAPILAAPLAWESGNGYRRVNLTPKAGKQIGFALIPPSESGLFFTNMLSQARALANANLMNGSGVALGDYDSDGLCDIYLCNLDGENVLYRNLGNWKFENVTALPEQSILRCTNQNSTGAVFADIDGNGTLDLLVSSLGGPNSCFLNQGNGRFVDRSTASGITSRLGATTLALADIDGNGTLDLYIANYGATSIIRSGGALNITYVNGKPVVRGRYAQRIQIIDNVMYELGEPDALYLNDGKGVFKAVSWTNGVFADEFGKPIREVPWDQGLSAMFYDINGDRVPDLYVCNDAYTPDRFWINDGTGRFRAINHLAWRSTSHFSMGVDFADFDRDGDFDFFVVDMLSRDHKLMLTQKGNMPVQRRFPGDLSVQVQMRRNTMFQNRGDATFAETAFLSGVAGSEWSWAGNFIDVDLDGWEDLLVSNGFLFNMDDMDGKQKVRGMGQLSVEQSRRTLLMFPPLLTPNMAFRNERNLTFSEAGAAWNFNATNISNGFAFGDLDNDGDLDTVVNCLNASALLYRNETSAPRLGVRLKGKAPNTQGIGATIRVEGGPVVQSQQVICGGRYASGDDPMRVFACGTNTSKLRIEVLWRSGGRSVVENAAPNSIYEIDESAAEEFQHSLPATPTPLFADVSSTLNAKHQEVFFNDLEAQPWLPNRLSQLGPGVTCYDLDDDGWDDLVVGAGRGGEVRGFRNERGRGWTASNWSIPAADDTSTILARRSGPGATELIVGLCTHETATTNRLVVYELRGTNLTTKQVLPTAAAIGPLALTEIRGELALFAGGRFVPRRYPEAAPSYLFKLRDGSWVEDKSASEVFSKLGLASGAVWTDLNNDGTPELVVSCEWGSIRLFDFASGSPTEKTKDWGLDQLVGRWQSVNAADIDGDGRMDLVAGNWGENSFYNQAADRQVHLFHGDFNGQGGIEMIEAYRNGNKVVPWRDMQVLSAGLPWLVQKYPSHTAFAEAAVPEILSERKFTQVASTWLQSALIFNRGAKSAPVPLPIEAQYTPVFGIAARDFDNDGRTDAVVAQNFLAVRDEDGSLEAGRSLLLRGEGEGTRAPATAAQSGLMVYGEQRGMTVLDFNNDGRLDLVIAQNGMESKLFENKTARAGIRIRLRGSAANPDALGAQIRIDDRQMLEVHSGGGYWSQETLSQIVPDSTKKLEIRWPSGKKSTHEVPARAQEIVIGEDGSVVVRQD